MQLCLHFETIRSIALHACRVLANCRRFFFTSLLSTRVFIVNEFEHVDQQWLYGHLRCFYKVQPGTTTRPLLFSTTSTESHCLTRRISRLSGNPPQWSGIGIGHTLESTYLYAEMVTTSFKHSSGKRLYMRAFTCGYRHMIHSPQKKNP